MEDKTQRRPLVDPVIMLLKSKRMIIAISGMLVSLLVLFVPQLEPVQNELLILVNTLSLALIGGYSYEDGAIASRKEQLKESKQYAEEIFHEVLNARLK